jgi:lipopolysaccharide/colanic/teichoic acid biosynthesis glycosyltransferase
MSTLAPHTGTKPDFRLSWLPVTAGQTPRQERVRHPFDVVGQFGWKRAIDILLSLVGITLTLPVMLLTAIVIKCTSPGPVFYRQERVGINRRLQERRRGSVADDSERRRRDRRVLVNFGKPFTIYKFRTMVVNAEVGTPPMWAKERDPRITSIGRALRKTRIDELPQFMNVLRGEMSIVGPRPERAYFIGRIEKELPDFHLRLRTKPGITGLAQVRLGYTNTDDGMRDKLHLDLEYIRHLSLWTDIKILFRTIFVVVTGKGAC